VPRTIQGQLALASLCQQSRHYHAAVRLYAGALTAQPTLSNDLTQGYRYNAACCALLAGVGPRKPVADEAAKLRAQALTWLRADLDLFARQFRAGRAGDVLLLSDRLAWWKKDPDLASVRDPQALATLPAAEPAAWRKLWADVEGLLKQVRAAVPETHLTGALTATGPEGAHELKASAGTTFVIDLHSTAFDTRLRLLDHRGKLLGAHHNLAPDNRDSRLIFTPPAAGTYRILAAPYWKGSRGAYTLTIRAIGGKTR
jgi:hypothetical protein